MKPGGILRAILVFNVISTVTAMTLVCRALHHADESERLGSRSHKTLHAAKEETLQRAGAPLDSCGGDPL